MASQRPLTVTGLNEKGDDSDDDGDDDDEQSAGAKRVLARLGVAMARYMISLFYLCLLPESKDSRPAAVGLWHDGDMT